MSPEIVELMALRRVSEGGVTVTEGCYTHHNRPLTGELAEALVRLHTAGYLTICTPGPGGRRPVHTTPAGAARAAERGRSDRPG